MEHEIEYWETIIGYEGVYEASNFGNIKSLSRIVYKDGLPIYITKERVLKPCILKNGYCAVNLQVNKNPKTTYVHRIIAKTFLANPLNKKDVNHINGNKTDNRLKNLEWATRSENKLHSFKTGISQTTKGTQNWRAKLTETHIVTIRQLIKTGKYSHRWLGKIFSTPSSSISMIVNRKSWKHVI